MKLKPATGETITYIDDVMVLLYSARREARLAGTPRLVAKIESAPEVRRGCAAPCMAAC